MLRVKTVCVTAFEQNARIIIDQQSGACAVVDPGGDLREIVAGLGPALARLDYVFLTHAHIDHGGKVGRLLELVEQDTGHRPKFVAHREEALMRTGLSEQGRFFGIGAGDFDSVPEPDLFAEDGMELRLGEKTLRIFHTPGHSPGHIVIYFPVCQFTLEAGEWDDELVGEGPLLIAGDVLFAGSVGRTDLPGGDAQTLLKSIREKVFCLPDETIVLPGHGPNTTVEREKRLNPFLREAAKSL